MKGKWDERFGKCYYHYGTEPNEFFKKIIDELEPGKLLSAGEGEGRNAVYAAAKGWDVTAFDSSIEGRKKALKLAEEQGVSIDYKHSDLSDSDFPDNHYDAVTAVYFHIPPNIRKDFHNDLVRTIKPGGKVIMEVFAEEQLGRESGGPKSKELLYSLEELVTDFIDLDFDVLSKETVMLDEGKGHKGEAVVIRFTGTKK